MTLVNISVYLKAAKRVVLKSSHHTHTHTHSHTEIVILSGDGYADLIVV